MRSDLAISGLGSVALPLAHEFVATVGIGETKINAAKT